MSSRIFCLFVSAVPVRAAEPAGERPADGGGARQAVQQHPGDRPPPHLPVEPGHAAGPGQGQAGSGSARPHCPAPRLQGGELQSQRKCVLHMFHQRKGGKKECYQEAVDFTTEH